VSLARITSAAVNGNGGWEELGEALVFLSGPASAKAGHQDCGGAGGINEWFRYLKACTLFVE
jgi:hypothetical protein